MPRIIIEEQVNIVGEIYEIRQKEYSIPETIIYGDSILYYNNYNHCYESLSSDKRITAEQYIQEQLNNINKKYTISKER